MTDPQVLKEDILLPYQKAWIQDNAPFKLWEKSRRIGASYAEALASVLGAAKERSRGGQDSYYISYNKDMTRQFIADCASWARLLNKAASEVEELIIKDEDKDITVYKIRFASGYEIWGLPSEARSLRSKQGRVIIDEAAFVDDLPALLKAATALTMWGGSVIILSTHNGEDNPFNELIRDIREGKKSYSLHRTPIDDALKQGLYKRICLVGGKDWSPQGEEIWLKALLEDSGEAAGEEYFCIPLRGSGHYLPRSLVESAMEKTIPVFSHECSSDFTYEAEYKREEVTACWLKDNLERALKEAPPKPGYLGVDFGRSGDLSVLALFQEVGGRRLEALFFVELRNVPFRQQFQIYQYLWDHYPRLYASSLDARGNGQQLAEEAAQSYGQLYVNQVMVSQGFYREYFPKYKARLEDGEIKLPASADIVDDHRTVIICKGLPVIAERTHQRGDRTKKRHGDSVVAILMALHAWENDGGSYQEYQYHRIETSNPWRGVKEDGYF